MFAKAVESQIDTWNHLDNVIPLDGASHDEVARYSVETTWRKAECVATLVDGRTVKLRDAWQFVGYTGRDPVTSLLFCHQGLHMELQIDANYDNDSYLPAASGDLRHGGKRYTAVDGSLITVADHCLTVLRHVSQTRPRTASSPGVARVAH